MSRNKRKYKFDSNKVSNLNNTDINIDLVEDAMKKLTNNSEKYEIYTDFCNKYLNVNLEDETIEQLTKIYEAGSGLINSYYIENNADVKENNMNQDVVAQIQSIIMRAMYIITTKRFEENNRQNIAMNKNLSKATQSNNKMKKDFVRQNHEIKNVKNEVKTIITTIISIVLAISVIPTAITGLEKVRADYILPFISTVILFGMIMIVFVYSIYQDKIKLSTWIILSFTMAITVIMWVFSIIPTIKINKDINANEIETENIQQEN